MNVISDLRKLLLLPRELREQPEMVASIRRVIEQDDDALRFYVRWMQYESNLHWVLVHHAPAHSAIVGELRREVRRSRLLRAISAMAIVALLLFVGLLVHFQTRSGGGLTDEAGAQTIAGRIESETEAAWSGKRPEVGQLVTPGQRLHALEGSFLLHLKSGATVAGTAPVDLEVVSESALHVHHGDVCVHVPARARGFRVNTTSAELIDLGTLFGLRVTEEGLSEVHVIDGLVEARARNAGRRLLSSGISSAIDSGGRFREPRSVDTNLFLSQMNAAQGIVGTTGELQVSPSRPATVDHKGFMREGVAHVFRERAQLQLSAPITVAAATPGQFTPSSLPPSVALPEGTKLATYLVHMQDPRGNTINGTVTFRNRILGFVYHSRQLDETDAVLGHPDVAYPTGRSGIGRGFMETVDALDVSADCRTITVKMTHGKGAMDQLRVIVFADEGSKRSAGSLVDRLKSVFSRPQSE